MCSVEEVYFILQVEERELLGNDLDKVDIDPQFQV